MIPVFRYIYKFGRMNDLKIGIIIPDRGDRPKLLENCLRMMDAQTKRPDEIMLVNDPPPFDDCDITYRYRTGYERLMGKNLDAILFIENDDWYHPQYIERFTDAWLDPKNWIDGVQPNLLGHNHTIYYHIHLRAWLRFDHHNRASAMNTLIRPDMNFYWGIDTYNYTDIWLWHKAKTITHRKIIQPDGMYCMGIKHNVGKTGGEFHSTYLDRFKNQDPNMDYLREHMDPESFAFYSDPENFTS